MSYLGALRITFAGKFQANVSTVNNLVSNFDTRSFQPGDLEFPTGGFNPQGDASFRLLGCRVTGVAMPGPGVDGADPVLRCLVADTDRRASAKMCDLDPQQQLCSEIWGLEVRLTSPGGRTLLRGQFEAAAFLDIWLRTPSRYTAGIANDMNAGATYQSVLTHLEWWEREDDPRSPVLVELRKAATAGQLSIKFNVDGVNHSPSSPDFMCGRIVGTIGPATDAEPRHLVLGRQLMAKDVPNNDTFFTPAGQINFFPARLDPEGRALYLDLGNALPTTSPAGPLGKLGDLVVQANGVRLGVVPESAYAGDPTWYERTAGVVALPIAAEQLAAVKDKPISLTGAAGVSIAEAPNGAFVRADRFVYRLSPGERVDVPVFATRWGEPLPNAGVSFVLDHEQLQAGGDDPGPGHPETDPVPHFNVEDRTKDDGVATLTVTANAQPPVRLFAGGSYIDGQVYGIRPRFVDPDLAEPEDVANPQNFVSLRVWSDFQAPSPVTWDTVQPILQQYANLYPVMRHFVDLGSEASVAARKELMRLAFALDLENPNAMPVTRDLSPAKRKAILSFLDHLDEARDTPAPKAAPAKPAPAAPRSPALSKLLSPIGGKAAALARRFVLRKPSGPARIQRIIPKGATDVEAVRALLQQAVKLEHATLPLYLYALYSLDEAKNAEIAGILSSVVVEEMLHMILAGNLLNALGGKPALDDPGFVPKYPGPLPGGVESELTVHLAPFSMDQLETFIALEQPADPLAAATAPVGAGAPEAPVTIGEFYADIKKRIEGLAQSCFVSNPGCQIGPRQMPEAVVVTDLKTALQAIETIIVQGEGTRQTPDEVVGGLYAHYYRFMEIKKGRRLVRTSTSGPVEQQFAYAGTPIHFDPSGVYAVRRDPSAASYPAGSQERVLCDRFNYTYTSLLRSLQATLNGDPDQLATAIGLMMSLKGQARAMMSGVPNSNHVGPSFEDQRTDPT